MDIRRKITDLKAKLAAAAAREADLQQERPAHALASTDGRPKAKAAAAKIAKIDDELETLGREARTLNDALIPAEALQLDEQRQAWKKSWALEVEAFEGYGERAMQKAREADDLLRRASEALDDAMQQARGAYQCACANKRALAVLLPRRTMLRAIDAAGLNETGHPGTTSAPLALVIGTVIGSQIQMPPFGAPPATAVQPYQEEAT